MANSTRRVFSLAVFGAILSRESASRGILIFPSLTRRIIGMCGVSGVAAEWF